MDTECTVLSVDYWSNDGQSFSSALSANIWNPFLFSAVQFLLWWSRNKHANDRAALRYLPYIASVFLYHIHFEFFDIPIVPQCAVCGTAYCGTRCGTAPQTVIPCGTVSGIIPHRYTVPPEISKVVPYRHTAPRNFRSLMPIPAFISIAFAWVNDN
jgi:hypothetical protein